MSLLALLLLIKDLRNVLLSFKVLWYSFECLSIVFLSI
nr:MAG TPA: hypothetical protein [Caudoviricetes sp.]